DDGSTDGSAEICKRYLSDPRVTYYHKENEGLAAARQDGMERALGEYIGFIDSDDWAEPNMYERMYEAAKSNDSDVVYCNCMENENGHRSSCPIRSGPYDRAGILKDILPVTLAYVGKNGEKRVFRWSNCLRLYKFVFLNKHGIAFDRRFRRSQDLQLTYEATLVAQNYYCLGNKHLYHNRVVKGSLSRGYTKNMWSLYVPLIERIYKDTEDFKELDLMPQAHLRAFFWVTDCIENELKDSFPYDEEKRVELIREIVEHPLCDRYYGKIDVSRMTPLYRKYYKLIRRKDAEGIITFTKKHRASEASRSKRRSFKSHLADFITEGKVTGSIYKKLRNKK
ncbi:MAG: glycosyltransferase, partial [Clostridia bacterium]|nr:glycosyltransferase [Clostridia bacterium]